MTQLEHTRTPIRLVRPVLAWVAACGASGLTLFASFGLLGALEDAPTARDMAEFVGATIPATLLLSLYIALFTALPTLAAAWLMHWRGWQGLTASGLLGFLAGGALVQVISVPGFVPRSEIGVDHHLWAINRQLGLEPPDALPFAPSASTGSSTVVEWPSPMGIERLRSASG